jgi:segregation and condensation protein B
MAESNSRSEEYKRIAEAALFASGRAMGPDELAGILGIAAIGYVKTVMNELTSDYEARNCALIVSKVGDKYLLSVRDQYLSKVNTLAGSPDISKSALRILAYVGKNEPVMQNSLVKAFGTSTYDHVKELVEKDFVKTARVGRTKKLETTQKFREYFSL